MCGTRNAQKKKWAATVRVGIASLSKACRCREHHQHIEIVFRLYAGSHVELGAFRKPLGHGAAKWRKAGNRDVWVEK